MTNLNNTIWNVHLVTCILIFSMFFNNLELNRHYRVKHVHVIDKTTFTKIIYNGNIKYY